MNYDFHQHATMPRVPRSYLRNGRCPVKTRTKTAKEPPKSSLPLRWTNYNGLQELDRDTRRINAKLAPLDAFVDFAAWLTKLRSCDLDAWVRSIGWVEFTHYWTQGAWLMTTGYPCVRRIARDESAGAP